MIIVRKQNVKKDKEIEESYRQGLISKYEYSKLKQSKTNYINALLILFIIVLMIQIISRFLY